VGAPAIAGQTSNFIQWQLVFFRTGRRHNQIMQALAGGLSDVDIRKIGAYFASLPVPQPPAPKDDAPALTEAGATLSAQRHCTSCHGEKLEGQAAAPRLARQPEAYLAKSLIDYRSGARPSSGGAAMTEVAGGLSDDDIKDVAHYLAVLPE
jgi:cytochrome c553